MRPWPIAPVLALLANACGAQVVFGPNNQPDAAVGDAAPEDAVVPIVDAAAIDAVAVPRCASRTVFLNFEGQTLTQGLSDATLNQASWMTIPQGTAPRYRAGAANRAAQIQAIVDGVRNQLSQFPITVTTTRPATGNYVMIVYGGQRGNVGSNYTGAVNTLDCGDARPNDVAWVSDAVSPPQLVINFTVGAIGFGLGLTATNDPMDCLCAWDNDCNPATNGPCRLGSPVAVDPGVPRLCGAGPTQDEVAAFRKAFCE